MKKAIALITVLSVIAMLLTACGSKDQKQETTTTAETAAETVTESETAAETEEKTTADDAEEAAFTDGTYSVEVTMEGGTGRASIQSPATVIVKDGKATAVVIWSSENYDYMIVDEVRYDPIKTEGGSTFKIPVAAFDEPLTVIGDTTAMSEPHEIEYTFTFNSSTMADTADLASELAADAAGRETTEGAADEAEVSEETPEESR